jgi:hypothetical protein
MADPHSGGCLCGAVRWAVDAVTPLAHCHCSVCRKIHGTAFATYMAAQPNEFRFTKGEPAITWYESSPGFRRAFCSHCGSVVPGIGEDGHRFIPAGCFDTDPGVVPKIHLFTPYKADWYALDDSLRQFDAFPGKDGPTELSGPAMSAPTSLRKKTGSCQCGRCAYEVTAPIEYAHNCHCGRCRKALSAAYGANGFVSIDALTFSRGEEHIVRYRLADAEVFAQAFCKTCGSILPRREQPRGIAVIPLGSLDSAPETGPVRHIFVDSKAPWFEIKDNLPQAATI